MLPKRKSVRLGSWDYSSAGYYFVTICAKDREHLFGTIVWTGASPVPTISQIVGTFKSKTSLEYLKFIKENNFNASAKIWQRSFHDHIIRNERSLNAIREYIFDNPINWQHDIDNLINIG